jgi:hypothetical protein
MVARRRTKRRDQYQPHLTGVLRIGAGLEDVSIHHDHVASLELPCGARLVEKQAAPGPAIFSPGGGQLHVGRADGDELAPTRANVNQETDETGRVGLTGNDIAVEDDDPSQIESIDPHDFRLELKPIVLEREAGPLQGLPRPDPPRRAKALPAFASKDDLPRIRTITRRRSQSRDDRDSHSPGPVGRRAELNDTAV